MKRILAALLLAIGISTLCPIVNAAPIRPLSESDLLKLLAGGVYPSRVADLVEEHGITFAPTEADLSSLRQAGGGDIVERAVRAAGHLVMQQELNLPKTRPHTQAHAHSLHYRTRSPSVPASLPAKPANNFSPVLEVGGGDIPIGTRINPRNWREYQRYMPTGMIALFRGSYFWKMPADFEMDIGGTTALKPSRNYRAATEEYSRQARLVLLPDGHHDIQNYQGGEPFPNPQPPDKGDKLLADLWFSYIPHLVAGTSSNPLTICTQTRESYSSCIKLSYVYRQMAYNTDPNVAMDETGSRKYWYTEWMSIEEPEQLKYTTQLTLYPKDNQRPIEQSVFIPALRRWLRVSLTARCSPIAGTDYTQDDFKRQGFNGGIGSFDARFLDHRRILALAGSYDSVTSDFPAGYYTTFGWPKPSWGRWQLRDVDVIDVRRIPAEQAGYCYGKRIIYEDSELHYALWEDVYDTNLQLWKMGFIAQRTVPATGLGEVPGAFTSTAWDVKSGHITNTSTRSSGRRDMLADADVPGEYQDLNTYSTIAGLAEIMK
ncbi:MAG TPA: DUF1329 domain-containing protein [Candidatus Binataceae bacterium]|nr:DUF1329 domain-containing protein [Candidatus Binataceae bacterium]